ncbi:MAG TPA: glycosyltransferase family 2 protein [Gammaproteobacteria bacterium]|nr:glycosyltransferase family 2 protein [Gammaproteobacteria bacterium]
MDYPNISVIIVNYNSGIRVSECVASVLRYNPDVEVIVVDNGSSDDSVNQLLAICPEEPRLHLLCGTKNRGFAAANNSGISVARGDILLFLNPDCVVEPDTLALLRETLDSSKDVAMVGGLLMNPDGSEQIGGRRAIPTPWRTFVQVTKLNRLANRYPRLFADFNLHKQPLPDSPVEVEAISGACMAVSRKAYEDVGGMDEGYFLHCEDLDWCMAFRVKGWKILFDPEARLVHYAGSCSKGRPYFVEWHKHKGMMRFYRKYFRHQYPGALMWLVTCGVWSRFMLVVSRIYLARCYAFVRGRDVKTGGSRSWRDEPSR